MYNTKFSCTYNTSNDEKFSDILYRKDILGVFNIKDCDFEKHETEIYEIMLTMYDKLVNNEKFAKCINKVCSLFFTEDLFIGFTILFSYDFLYLTHPCICEFFGKNNISDDKINILLDILEKKK